ncbi:MAG: hypothetical protein ABJP33_10360 [Pseudoruegeria sp.]
MDDFRLTARRDAMAAKAFLNKVFVVVVFGPKSDLN